MIKCYYCHRTDDKSSEVKSCWLQKKKTFEDENPPESDEERRQRERDQIGPVHNISPFQQRQGS
jgi:hypothetical protein